MFFLGSPKSHPRFLVPRFFFSTYSNVFPSSKRQSELRGLEARTPPCLPRGCRCSPTGRSPARGSRRTARGSKIADAFLFSAFFSWPCFFGVHRNRLRVFVFRDFIFWFASKGLAVEKAKHSRLLHPPSFGRCILTARQFMRGAQLPRGSGHSLRSRTVRLPCRRSMQSEREMCFPKRCRAQACFQEALSEVVLSLVARGAHGSAIAQWRAAASPRFHLRAICGKKIIGIRKIASAFLYCAFLFFGEQNWSSPKCPPRFYFPRFFLGRVFFGVTKIASAFFSSAFFFF